jgi:hypothetical protein
VNNFPIYNKGQAITAATVSGVTLIVNDAAQDAAADVMLYNAGPSTVHVVMGDASAVADTTCVPLPGGTIQVFSKGKNKYLATLAVGAAQPILAVVGSGD